MAISEKQLMANRLNALKSTGPKTAEGKSRSRRNVIKHSLTGSGACLPGLVAEEVSVEYHALAEIVRPQDLLEQRLVEQAAIGSIRFLRAQAQSEAIVRKGQRRALRDWDARHERRVEHALRRLDVDAATALRRLSSMAEGCDALSDEWDALRQVLESSGRWAPVETQRALRLLGEAGLPTVHSSPRPAAVLLFSLATRDDANPRASALFFTDPAAGPDLLPPADEARAEPLAIAGQEAAEWARRADELWDRHDGPDRASAADQVLVDLKPEMARLTRYGNEGAGLMHRALRMLMVHRKEQARIDKAGGLAPPGFGGRPRRDGRNEAIWTRPMPPSQEPKLDLGEGVATNLPAAGGDAATSADRAPGRSAHPSPTPDRPAGGARRPHRCPPCRIPDLKRVGFGRPGGQEGPPSGGRRSPRAL